MNSDAENANNDTTDAPAAIVEDAPTKPARRKRAVKSAADVAEGAVTVPEEGAAMIGSDGEAPAKPARKRRTAKPAAETISTESPAEPIAPLQMTMAAIEPAASQAPVAPAASAAPVSEPAGIFSLASSAPTDELRIDSGEGAEQASSAAPPVEGGPRSERSRRRNRRDRRRGRDADAAVPEGATASSAGEDADADVAAPAEPLPTLPAADVGEVFAQVVSGEFDVDDTLAEDPVAQEHKRILRPEPDAPKLHKVLAQAGVGSRRDMEQLILDGKITVNGQPAHIGQRISFGDHIKVDGKPVKVRIVPAAPRILAYHKPVGEVVTHDDPQHRPTVFRRLPRLPHGKWQSVGRLDLNTEGLLLFTNSGELANQLMHPRFGVEREYAVRVLGTLDEDLKDELLEGVTIDGQTAHFKSIQDGGGEGANHWYRVVITEGRNREVRKMFEEVGLTVSRLIRIRYGSVVLPRGLKRGVWVDLSDEDVRAVRRLAGHGDGQRQGQGQAREERGGRSGRNKNRGRTDSRNDRGPRPNTPQGNRQQPYRAEPPRDDVDFEGEDDIDHSRIPNPLEQTFDKRFVQNPRTSVGGRGFRSGGGGFGAGGSGPNAPKKGSGPREPDPLQTSVGYIGADAFHRKGGRGGGGGGGGGGFGRGGSGGGGRRGR